jgi:DNA-directed RNA polymerase specialized sigma24 family protein
MTSHMSKNFNNDNELFEAIMNNNALAIKQYYETIFPPLCGYTYKWVKNREVGEDIASYSFAKTLGSDVSFRDLKHMNCYMYTTARWGCLDYLKKNPPPYNVPLEKVEEMLSDDTLFEEDFIRFEYLKLVYAEIKKLPRELDRRILLMTMASYTPEEISRATGKSTRYVQRRLRILAEIIRNGLIDNNLITVLLLLFFIK